MLQTASSLLAKARIKAMESAGIPVELVLADVTRRQLALPAVQRTPEVAETILWEVLEKVSADPDIGARLGKLLPQLRGHVVEYFFSSSSTFGGALVRTLAYQRLISPNLSLRLDLSGGGCCLVDENQKVRNRHLVECFTGGAIRFLRAMSDGVFIPQEIHFMHRQGASSEEYRLLFDCPVKLGQPENRLYFNIDSLPHALWHADLSLQKMHEKIAEERLQEAGRHALVDAVTRTIALSLEGGDFGIDAVAKRLGTTRRKLQTDLAAVDTHYNQLLNDYRFLLATELLKAGESIENIVALTGFSEVSAFYRAFRRWTGTTPTQFREHIQQRNA